MDQLKAYEILELDKDASIDDIKKAYARLSKQYHPEEYPEKFQSLYEAYSILMKNNRHHHNHQSSVSTPQKMKKKPIQVYDKEIEWSDETKELDFDRIENQTIEQEKQRLHVLSIQAQDEFCRLLQPPYCYQLKKFKEFFRNEKYIEIIRSDEFVDALSQLLSSSTLKKNIYDYIIDFYRLRGLNLKRLMPEMKALYQVLDKKRGMNTKNKENIIGTTIPIIFVLSIYRSLRSIARSLDNVQSFFALVFIGVLMLLGYKLYQRIYENHSSLFSQTIVLLLSIVLHIIVIMFGLYGFVFRDVDLGNVFAFVFILIAFLWLIVLTLIALVKRIKRI